MGLIDGDFPENTAVISFYTPKNKREVGDGRVDYKGRCKALYYVAIPDIDIEILADYGYTYDSYLKEATELSEFIYKAKNDGLDIICQCDYGQSRSAACAAAISEHFYKNGIEIFADYRYYPNQLCFHKIFDALKEEKRKNEEL